MSKSLVIVESPAKARTINKYLGKDFIVKASMGHVRDLPKGKLGIDVEHDFEPQYLVIRNRSETVKELKKTAKASDAVYLAPDPDREGEAIAWHLVEALDLPEEKVFRITFNEITKRAVQAALAKPGKLDRHRIDAQQARRILDRLVGYKLSPLLWEKIARGLSAGRVQSVAVRLIVEREREIRAFRQEEYWTVDALVRRRADGEQARDFKAELKRRDGKPIELPNEAAADEVLEDLAGRALVVASVERKKKSVKAPPPFSTSLLQQQASTRLRFSAKKTMRTAQQLYEGVDVGGDEGSVGLITYMRTDSYRLAGEAIETTRAFVKQTFGERYVPEKPNIYAARKGAQEAHEAIRPTDVRRTPEALKQHLPNDLYRLYKLIWDRVVACQMANALYDQTSVTIHDHDPRRGADQEPKYVFAARGRALVFDGWLKVAGQDKGDEQDLPALEDGDALETLKLEKEQHFTQPPPRYSEATLVKSLEKNGIGRPSTYAAILSTIQDRGYTKLLERKFHATELGEVVNDSLVAHFPEIVDPEFTAGMESKLDLIEDDRAEWLKVVRDFYTLFEKDLEKAQGAMTNLKAQPAPSGEKCPECGRDMLLRFNRWGRFLGCSGYPECKHVQRVTREGKVEDKRPAPEPTGHVCEKCGKPMVIRTGKRGRFLSCTGFPKCKNSCSVDAEGNPIRPKVAEGVACPKCEGAMIVRFSKRGPFLGCQRYPKCRGTRQISPEMKEKLGELVPPKREAPADTEGGDEGDGDGDGADGLD